MEYSEAVKLFKYDPETGILSWRGNAGRWGTIPSGTECGSINNKGYRVISTTDRRVYPVHRIIWLIVTGRLPDRQIDHINGDKLDNRIANLREATHAENQMNRQGWSRSGFKGVSLKSDGKHWAARIWNGKNIHLGQFKCRACAAVTYDLAAIKAHGEFAVCNILR